MKGDGDALGCIAAAALILSGEPLLAQNYLNKPIRIVTTTAGGGTELLAHIIG